MNKGKIWLKVMPRPWFSSETHPYKKVVHDILKE